ncbi:MAG: methyltransferase domain-containing protein [Proteobacteria bacterium]|uniref:class I SAM-dependent methyltransferase n=1 Tax=Aquabacterium sp. TaxID=1872578 RepID=UPI0035C6B266|nr:methyltransferase domain-containing protein [Pseudomonadota bacterium]
MYSLPAIHLCIIQPPGYIHSLGFLDQARYFRHQFRRMGAEVTLSKNRLRHDAVNIIFGAHLGFEASLRTRYSCIFVNLEQLGQGGASMPASYMSLLGSSAVIDYDARNVPAYTQHVDDVSVVPFLNAPYLQSDDVVPLRDRPIDVLFIGSLNDRRRDMLARIESTGAKVVLFDAPLYGPERDSFIKQAKCVFNAHFYESSRFEQARVSLCLSLGTPVVSERLPASGPHPAFEDSVFWVNDDTLESFFADIFPSEAYVREAERQLSNFRSFDPIEAYADVLAFAAGFGQAHQGARPQEVWRPHQINLGSGKDYKPGWLNIDVLDRAEPDLLLDLGCQVEWPVRAQTAYAGPLELDAGSVDVIYANNVLEHVPDLPTLMSNCLDLLKVGGRFLIEVPYEHAQTAWQDPTHIRAMNERSWVYYTDWFWYLGWFESRYKVDQFTYLDTQLKECGREQAAFMKVLLVKVETTMQERMIARAMQANFGGIPDDETAVPQGRSASTCVDVAGGLAGSPLVPLQPRVAPRAEAGPWLVLAPSHDDHVTENFSWHLANALRAHGHTVHEVNVSGDPGEQLQGVDLGRLSGVISVGAVPLGLSIGGVPFHRVVTCPYHAYVLDSIVYDLARVPAVGEFIHDAWSSERLIPVLAEGSYLQLARSGSRPLLPPQSRYVPFAAFTVPFADDATPKALPPQNRLLVVGALGRELSGGAIRQDLMQTLQDANRCALSHNELGRLADRLLAPSAPGNPMLDVSEVLNLHGVDLFTPDMLHLGCAADSFLKRSRRLAGVMALRGQPVDFIGPGWEDAFGDEPGFRFLGSVEHPHLPRLMALYKGVVNFDPNWSWGMHDRAYTALSLGVPVMTHANRAIQDEGLPAGLVHEFLPNAPVLAGAAAECLAKPHGFHEPVSMDKIGWQARMSLMLQSCTEVQS